MQFEKTNSTKDNINNGSRWLYLFIKKPKIGVQKIGTM